MAEEAAAKRGEMLSRMRAQTLAEDEVSLVCVLY